MSVFSRGLVAVSLTEPDRGLLRYAAIAAQTAGVSAITFAHIVSPDHQHNAEADPQPLLAALQQEVEREFGAAPPGVSIRFEIALGSRVDQLIGLAVKHEADVMWVGHRKIRSGRRALARRLAMTSPCSVWLVPEGSPAGLTRILVPTDFSSHSADALRVACSLAAASGLTRCQALHVYFDSLAIRYDEHLGEIFGNEQAEFEQYVASTQTSGVVVDPIFEESSRPATAILRVAEQQKNDLIVMNTRGRSRSAAVLLGSTTSEIMAGAQIPVLAVKHFGARMSLLSALLSNRFWEEPSPKTN